MGKTLGRISTRSGLYTSRFLPGPFRTDLRPVLLIKMEEEEERVHLCQECGGANWVVRVFPHHEWLPQRMGCRVEFKQYCYRCYPFEKLLTDRIYWRHLPDSSFHYSTHPGCTILSGKSDPPDLPYQRFLCYEPILKKEGYDTALLWKKETPDSQ